MNNKVLRAFLKLNNSDKILSVISLFFGFVLILNSLFFIWAYNFTSMLFIIMIPMTVLVSGTVIGIFFVLSGYYRIVNREKSIVFYTMTGVLMILYPLNHAILLNFNFIWLDNPINSYLALSFGLFFYFSTLWAKIRRQNNKQKLLQFEMLNIVFGFTIYFLIDVIFSSWNYLDRIL